MWRLASNKPDESVEGQSETLQRYLGEMETSVPALITHPGDTGEGRFLHFDSSVAKIDALYHSILMGDIGPAKRQRRDAVGKTDLGPLQHEAKAVTELQLTVQGLDQEWNIEVLKGAYEGKVVGIRLYSNALDLIKRSMSIREAQFKLLIQRYVKQRNFDGLESLLLQNEGKEVENDVVFDVIKRIPVLTAKHTMAYNEMVGKLIRLNTLILTEQVRVFQQIRDSDLVLKLRWPYPITESQVTKDYVDMVMPKKSIVRKQQRRSNHFKVEIPAPMDCVLRTKRVLDRNTHPAQVGLWKNPGRQNSKVPCTTDPMPQMLMLDCNTLKPHHEVKMPMRPAKNKKSLNLLKTIPPINSSSKRTTDPSSFTLPLVCTYSTTDSGYDGSNVILDPARYM